MLYICSWYAYDSWNRVQTMTYPDGEVVTYHYNAGQVERMTSNKQGRQSVIVDRIGYDKEGHTVYTKLGNGTETTYTYDRQRERLQVMNLTADGQTVMENRYRYDAVDNILGITNAANPTSLTKLNKAKLGGRSSHTYEYDELNRLVHASGKAKCASYDMVIRIQTPQPNTTPNTNPGPPVSWNDPSNPDDPQAGYGYIPNDTTKEETFFYHSDHLGSTSYITDDKANITQYDAYLPYGELLVDEHSSSEDLPYKFNGKQFDEETGLYYYGARYMDPVTSLFFGVDTKVELKPNYGGSLYYLQNPILLIDPDGNWEKNSNGNLVAQRGDNAQTLAEFIGVTAKESLNILLANGVTINKKGILSLKEGQEIISNIITDVVCLGHAKAGNGNENKITDTGSANTPWMDIATSQIGVSEIPGNKSNPQIVAYHATTCRSTSDATPWCSSFVNWSLTEAGIRGTNSASSQSWLTWGKRISKPVYGCIAVLSYGGGHGHVAFVVGMNARGNIILLGGNQHDQVNLSPFKAKMTYVYPRGYTPSKEPLRVLQINGRTTSYRETR